MEQNKNSVVLPVIVSVIVTIIVVGGGMYWWQTTQTAQLAMDSETVGNVAVDTQIVVYNCKQSGGSYTNGTCACSDGEYDEDTGYCITAFGTPGGALHEEAAKLQELKILKNTVVSYNCEQSGGAFGNDECSCPIEQNDQLEYDSNTGYCMSAFGIPGGDLGETAKKLQELNILKNQ